MHAPSYAQDEDPETGQVAERRGSRDGHVDVAVVVVTYHSVDDVRRLLLSLPSSAPGLSLRVIVVDNASADGTVEAIREFPDVTCVEVGANLGYAGAINIGRAYAAPCSAVLILNPDLTIEPGSVRRLFEAMSDPGTGAVVPLMLDQHGCLYRSVRRDPSILRALGDALFGNHLPGRPGWLSEIVRQENRYGERRSVDWATGAAVLVSAACDDQVGPWDERFFLYSEETDYLARVRAAGWRVDFVPDARVCHRERGSGHAPALDRLMAVNRIRYYVKVHPGPSRHLFRGAVVLHELLRARWPVHRDVHAERLTTVLRTSLPGPQRGEKRE